jgi:hypothetical protein
MIYQNKLQQKLLDPVKLTVAYVGSPRILCAVFT